MRPYLIGGVAVGLGAALLLQNKPRRSRTPVQDLDEHWPPSTRVAVGLIGGGLMIYVMRTPGRMGRIASTTGIGLVTRSVNDIPIHNWTEMLKPHLTLGV